MADRDLSGCTLGEFVLRERIGRGGYGAVYRCEQPSLKRLAVVKVLRRTSNDVAHERFLREAQLASQLDHPYAAHVYAFGTETSADDRLLWIAMELVQGITLAEWLKTRGPMPLEQFVPFFECVAEVVQAAHQRGIVHRDLKPSNVMVIEGDGRLFPKLLDFGIAKVDGELDLCCPEQATSQADDPTAEGLGDDAASVQRTRTGPAPTERRLTGSDVEIGSRPYMSPEQWSDASSVGPATDIYSLGVVAYEALTGRVPFVAGATDEYRRQHCHAEVPPLGCHFDEDVDRVIRRALAKDPGHRQSDVLALARELRAALRTQPREQIRSLAQVWEDRARSPALLLKSDDLMRAPTGVIGELERSFVAESRRHVVRRVRIRRLLAVSAVAIAFVAVWYRGMLETESARRVAEATTTQAELEQGRSALLHNEPEALKHLTEAYRRDHSPATVFMLARAAQPRLAEQARFASTAGRMWSAAFSPDGTRIVTADDKNAQVWDAQSQRHLFTLPHGDTVYQAAYTHDGTGIVTTGSDGVIRIWNAQSGAPVRELRQGTAKRHYYAVAMPTDDRFIAAIDSNGEIAHLWNLATGALVAEIRNDGSSFPAIAFSGDGHWLATTGGREVQVFDVRASKPAVVLRGPNMQSLAFDPGGTFLVTGATSGDVSIWELPNGRSRHLGNVGDSADAVAFSPDGQLVAAASRGGVEHVWRAASGEVLSQFNPRHTKILALEFDRTSQLLLAAGADGAVVVADPALGMPITVLEGPRNTVWVAHFDPRSERIIGASLDGTAWVWDARSPYRRWSAPPVSDDCGIVTSPEPDRRFVAVGCRNRATRVWDTSQDRLVAELPSVSQVNGDFTSAFPAVSREGDRAAIARGATVQIFELPSGRLLRTITHTAPVNAVTFASTGRDIVSGAVDGSLLVARDSGALLSLPTSPGGIDAVAFAPDGRIVAADARHRLRIYDLSGAVVADIELPMRAMSLRIEGTRMVAIPSYVDDTAPALLVDLDRHRIVARLDGHVGRIFTARWVAGDQIITAGADGTARLWDGSTGKLRQLYRGGSRPVFDAALASNNLVMAGCADGMLRFWDTVSGRLLWALPAHKSGLIGIHVEGDDIITRGFTGEVSRWRLPDAAQAIAACKDRERCGIVQE